MFHRKTEKKGRFDAARVKPVLRCSICTGEQVAGFQDLRSGKIEEIMLIRGEEDLKRFKELYGVEELEKVY